MQRFVMGGDQELLSTCFLKLSRIACQPIVTKNIDADPTLAEQLGQRNSKAILYGTIADMREIESQVNDLIRLDPLDSQFDLLRKKRAKLVALTPFRLLNASDPIPPHSAHFKQFQALAVQAIEILTEALPGDIQLDLFLKPKGLQVGQPNDYEASVYNIFPKSSGVES